MPHEFFPHVTWLVVVLTAGLEVARTIADRPTQWREVSNPLVDARGSFRECAQDRTTSSPH